MTADINNIHQLLLTDTTNATLVLQLIKKQPALATALQQEFAPVLDQLGKTNLSSVVTLLKKFHNDKKLSTKEKLALTAYPRLAATLTTLNLENCRLKALPDSMGNLTHLKRLYLFQNKIVDFPERLTNLQQLEHIYLQHNHLKDFPSILLRLSSLKSISIGDNKIKTLPVDIHQLSLLDDLELSNNKLQTLPETISQLQQLTALNLGNNPIQSLPESIGQLSKLKRLHLISWDNKISILPDSFPQLQALEDLSISSTVAIENLAIVAQCAHLTSLTLWLTKEREILEQLHQLQHLQYLCISMRQEAQYPLERLPDSIAQLPNLKQLEIYQHSFDAAERARVKALLPDCKVSL